MHKVIRRHVFGAGPDRSSLENDLLKEIGIEENDAGGDDADLQNDQHDDLLGDAFGDDDDQSTDDLNNEQELDSSAADEHDEQPNDGRKLGKGGHLYDAEGNKIAHRGKEVRTYRNLERTIKQRDAQLNEANNNLEQLRAKHVELANAARAVYADKQKLDGFFQQYKDAGLSNEELGSMLDIAALTKRDPLAGARKYLTMLASNGTNIKDLGVGSGGLDVQQLVSQITDRIDERMKPVTDQHREAEERRAAEQVARTFIQNTPHARAWTKQLQKVIEDTGLEINEAWTKMENSLLRSGVDPRKLTPDQAYELLNSGNKKPSTPQAGPPSGRGRQPKPRQRSFELDSTPRDPHQSYDQIANELIKEAEEMMRNA